MILDDDSLLEVLQFLSRYHVEHTRLVASIFQRQISLSDHLWPREMFFAEDLVSTPDGSTWLYGDRTSIFPF